MSTGGGNGVAAPLFVYIDFDTRRHKLFTTLKTQLACATAPLFPLCVRDCVLLCVTWHSVKTCTYISLCVYTDPIHVPSARRYIVAIALYARVRDCHRCDSTRCTNEWYWIHRPQNTSHVILQRRLTVSVIAYYCY